MKGVGRTGDVSTAVSAERPVYPSGTGSRDVLVNGRRVLRVRDPIMDRRGTYCDGEATVTVNGQPIVGQGHPADCGRLLAQASPNVIFGQGNIAGPGQVAGILYHFHVDADRDGRPDDDFSRNGTWEAGKGKLGAVLPVNCDDDRRPPRPNIGGRYSYTGDTRPAGEPDNTRKGRILEAADVTDLAPLDLRLDPSTAGRSAAGWKLRVVVSRPFKIRIFDKRAAGGAEIIGPTAGESHEITSPSEEVYEWAMEATQFPGPYPWSGTDPDPSPTFDGTVKLTLELWDPQGVLAHTEECVVRASPWMMFNHFDPTDEVLVADATQVPNPNTQMLAELTAAVAPTGAKLTILDIATDNDRWAQDVMEPGYVMCGRAGQPAERWSHPVILRSARSRGTTLEKTPMRLLGPDFGYAQATPPGGNNNSLDSFGNLECTPPFTHPKRGDVYLFGRIVYGVPSPGTTREGIQPPVVDFLKAQAVQDPIPIDSGWLSVGHVDEFLSFLPMKDAPLGFRVVVASPSLAFAILRGMERRGNGAAKVRWTRRSMIGDITVSELVANPHFQPLNDFVESKIREAVTVLMREVGLERSDFIPVPIIFNGWLRGTRNTVVLMDPAKPFSDYLSQVPPVPAPAAGAPPALAPPMFGACIAHTPGVVNGLVVTRGGPTMSSPREVTYVMPRPYGPEERGRCAFETHIDAVLGPSSKTGVTTAYADDFESYHLLEGEIHCGTNSIRRPPTDRFWWEQRTS